MNQQLFEFDTLEKKLLELPPFHQVAFAASCCERMLPNYNAFSRMYSWGDPSVPRTALDEVWQILQGKPINTSLVHQLKEDCGREDVFPDSLDFDDYCFEAQEALIAIRSTLATCLSSNSEIIISITKNARNTIELFIPFQDESFNISSEKDGSETFKSAIASHPLAVREMAKEADDLQRLKEAKVLDKDFLEWLRNSFDNEGKSLIDLG